MTRVRATRRGRLGRRLRRKGQRGQTLVETAIVMPIMIFAVLGALQLVMLQHAQVMTEYSAYCAARAGIVHNANWNMMRNAATLAALPIYFRTDDIWHFGEAWAKLKILNEATELVDTTTATLETVADDLLGMLGDAVGVNVGSIFASILPDVSLVEVDVTSPNEDDIERGLQYQQEQQLRSNDIDEDAPLVYPDKEVDFDQRQLIREEPRIGRLAVETRVLVPLKIPLVNWIIFQMWYAQEEIRFSTFRSSLQDWAAFQARVEGGAHSGKTLEQVVRDTEGRQVWDDFLLTSQRTREARLLRDFAIATHIYLIPLRASYAMQMQSNPYFENRRHPVWFEIGGGG